MPQRSVPHEPPLQAPVLTNISPNIDDFVLVDEWDIRQTRGEGRLDIAFGTPHPNTRDYPNYTFVWQAPASPNQTVKRYWCRTRSAQDAYNARYLSMSGENAFPQFDRTYFLPRAGYTQATKLSALTGLIGILLENGGTGFLSGGDGQIDLIFTGGTGTGGEGVAEVRGGVVVSVLLKDGGNYTVAPDVSAEGGTDLVITPVLQPDDCVLTAEVAVPEQQEFNSLFLRVTRTYETLPGPLILMDSSYDDETGAEMRTYAQRVVAGTTPPAYGSEFPTSSGFFVGNAGVKLSTEDAVAGWLHVEVMEQPDDRIAYRDGNYPTPDLFVPIFPYAFWSTPPDFPGIPSGPYQNRTDGLDYLGNSLPADVNHRGTYELQVNTPASPIKETYTYFITTVVPLPTPFYVTSQPGRLLPVTRNTVHGALTETYTDTGTGLSVVLENLRASQSPGLSDGVYQDGETVIGASQDKWKGCWTRRRVDTVEFPVLPNQ